MKWKLTFLFLLTLNSWGADLSLTVGEQLQTSIAATGPVRVSQTRAAKVSVLNGKVFILGKQPGEIRFTVGSNPKNYQVVVFEKKLSDLQLKLTQWLKERPELQLEVHPHKISIAGQIDRLSDWLYIHQFKKSYGTQIEVNAEPSSALLETLQDSLKAELQRLSMTHVQIQKGVARPWLEISTEDKVKVQKARALAESWGVELRTESDFVELKPMIEIEINIAEIKRDAAQRLGLRLPGSYSATVLASGDLTSFITTFAPLNATLNADETKSMGRLLASPKLLCRSGESAQFLAGGEIPLKIARWANSEIMWRKYGVILNISPKADLNGNISTKLTTEISSIDETKKVDGVPGLLTNRIETHFDIKGQRSIALSGLIKSESAKGSQGLPGLSSIPILGDLLSSHDFLERKTELVIFVTPRVITPSQGDDKSKYNFLWEDDDS